MPPVREYVVSQEREMTVRATSPAEAVYFAAKLFDDEELPDTLFGVPVVNVAEGNVLARVTETRAREAY